MIWFDLGSLLTERLRTSQKQMVMEGFRKASRNVSVALELHEDVEGS